jgi:hypothetical protein
MKPKPTFKPIYHAYSTLLIIFSLALTGLSFSSFAQTSREYTVDEIETLQTDLTAGTYDWYILSSSGGIYNFTQYVPVTHNAVIKAKDGLPKRPILMRTGNIDSNTAIIKSDGTEKITLTLDGLEFDGTTTSSTAAVKVIAFRGHGPVDLIVRNSHFHKFTNDNGIIRFDAGTSTLDVKNTLFDASKQRAIQLWGPHGSANPYGDINIEDCTFSNITGPVIFFRNADGKNANGTGVYIRHSTFHNINAATLNDGIIKTRQGTIPLHIINSVFTDVTVNATDAFQLATRTIDYCYLNGIKDTSGNILPPDPARGEPTNSFTAEPVYENTATLDFAITNFSELICGNTKIAGDLTYYFWKPSVKPELTYVDNTTVKIHFSRHMNKSQAETKENYTLSGTGGLTQNPSQALLSAPREVTLTIADMSALIEGQTVIVTVADVQDIYGTAVGNDNAATLIVSDMVAPMVEMAAQTVTNGPGQTIIARSNETGFIYLLPEVESFATLAEMDALVDAAKGNKAAVIILDTDVVISTSGLPEGIYYAYAVDASGNISGKSTSAVIISDGIAPIVAMDAQNADNTPGKAVYAKSNEKGKLWLILDGEPHSTIIELQAAVDAGKGSSASVTTPDVDVAIHVDHLTTPGNYYAFATDLAGNISEKSTNSVTYTILPLPSVFMEAQNVTNDGGQNVIAKSDKAGKIWLILDGEPQSSVADFEAAVANGKGAMAVAVADTEVMINVHGLPGGTYYAYAVDEYGFISGKSENAAVIKDVIPPMLTIEPQTVSNAPRSYAFAKSDKPGKIYLVTLSDFLSPSADLDELVAARKASVASFSETGIDIAIPAAMLQEDTYHAIAVDLAGNYSFLSTNQVTVTQRPESQEYTVAHLAELEEDLTLGAYKEYILTTSGGVYDFKTYVSITSDMTIKAADGLENRPVLRRTNNTGSSTGIIASGGTTKIKIRISGLEFDGIRPEAEAVQNLIAFRGHGPVELTINDSYFHNCINDNGVIRFDAAGSSLDMKNSMVADSKQRIIQLYGPHGSDPANLYGKISIENSTFTRISGPIVFFRSANSTNAMGTSVEINHCTFHDINTDTNGLIKSRQGSSLAVVVNNSLFTDVKIASADIIEKPSGSRAGNTVDNCYLAGITRNGVITTPPEATNSFDAEPVPVYMSAFRLLNFNIFRCIDGDIVGDLNHYLPEVEEQLQYVNSTTLKISFIKSVEKASAENIANYDLRMGDSPSQQPLAAELINNREVHLTVSDMSSLTEGYQIMVTANNVKDLRGNIAVHWTTALLSFPDLIELLVVMENQSVTNESGQSIKASITKPGTVYLILDGEPQANMNDFDAAVQAKKGAYSVTVTAADVDVHISTEGLIAGIYYAYAVDLKGNISVKSENKITVSNLEFALTLGMNPEGAGTLSGAGTYQKNIQVTISAEANDGFSFLRWEFEDGTLASENATYMFQMPENPLHLVAIFEAIPDPEYALTLGMNPEGAGTLTGAGTFLKSAQVTVSAEANDGFIFLRWEFADGTLASENATYTFPMPENPLHLVAIFQSVVSVSGNFINNLTIYPNPAKEVFYLENLPANAVIRIYNITGKVILSGLSEGSVTQVDISGVNPGIYIIRVTDPISGSVFSGRIIKN